MPPIHSAQITAAYLAFSGMHQAPALCFNSREHLQGTSYFLLNGQLLFLRGLSGERAKNRVLLRRRQVQKKKNQAQEIQDPTVLLYLLSLVNVFLFPQAQAGLFSRPSRWVRKKPLQPPLSFQLPLSPPSGQASLVPVGTSQSNVKFTSTTWRGETSTKTFTDTSSENKSQLVVVSPLPFFGWHGMWDLSSWPGIKPEPLALEA